MWKKVHVLVILALIYPVIDCSKNRKKDSAKSTKCPRTNSKAFRYCTKRTCTSNGDCKSNEKCLCDGDCGMSCVRDNLKCQPPPKPKNSKQRLSKGFNFGSVVTYRCTGQYKVRGSATRTCRAIGQWDGRKARCRVMCDDPGDIAFGNRRYDGFQAGKTIIYWCYDAYELVGSPRMTCQNNGRWSASKPKCELPRCNPPRFPDEAIVIHPRKMPKKFKHSDTILLKCKDGYFKSGIGALKCKKGDIWTGGITCSPKSCGRPKAISHGKIIGYVYSFKEKVRYTCDEGYKLRGPAYRQCQANEKWSGSDPTCNAVDCGPLNAPVDGTIIERVAYTYGHRIVFECKSPGYEMKGSKIRTCQSDGQWSGSLTKCEIVKCNDPGTPANGKQIIKKGFFYGGSVTFECNKDYILEGTDTTYCQADKSWNSPLPRCFAPCQDPGIPYQGYRIGQDFRHGQTVRFTCPINHVMEGVAAIKCSDGLWDNNKPSCKAPCKEPADPVHGFKSGRDFKHGGSVRFSCHGGYQRVGAASITCNDGRWDSQNPVCKGICGRPRTSRGLRLHGNSYLDGDRVTFSCDKNLDLFGKAELRCVGRAWDSSEPECKARCTFMGRPEHGFYIKGARKKGDKIKHGERITYDCFRSYTLVGSNAQECNNGRWNNDRPSCKASCQKPGGVRHGVKIGNDFAHGKSVRYQCDGNYILEGKDRITCDDGKWNFDPPKCKAPCKEPADPVHGFKRGRDFKHGGSVRFSCHGGYQRVGAASITCNDGKWDSLNPVCKGICGRPRSSHGLRLHGNSFLDGDRVTFSCDKNLDLFGKAELRCVGRAWDSSEPECKARCTFMGRPEHGFYIRGAIKKGDKIKHGERITYDCFRSYTLVGNNAQECNNGRWNNDRPSCKASCQKPGGARHGVKIGSDFGHGKSVRYQCDDNYILEGKDRITCDDGKWNFDPPKCKASCAPLKAPRDGKIQNNDIKHSALVSFSCNDGFQMNGSRILKCIDGKWNGSAPTCKGFCKDPRPLKNGIIRGNDFRHGSTVEFQCNSHYQLNGSQFATCVKGKWNPSVPKCFKRCQRPVIPQNGWLIGINFAHGGDVRIVCKFKNGTLDLRRSSKITCNHGVWSGPIPSCEASCAPLKAPRDGKIQNNDIKHSTLVFFSCNDGFQMNGSRILKCIDGKWNGSAPTCKECGRALGMENYDIKDSRITSPARRYFRRQPSHARLNGNYSWCALGKTYLQIDLGKDYKVTSIATQGGSMDTGHKWVKQYKVAFYAGATRVMYSESGLEKNAFYLVPCFGDYGREMTTHLTTTELLSQELQPVTSISFYK
ncbi:sushi, von Willebrand factor type A, EGF and pentraxin domain-containing protein 1-like isoform X2 [Porites lutea]|uniref:sushi, von Willebrand factor type A, EGF and pentraxin domain-containing protein 1-like isoform X2 n=1 Tax=Porites lutea TaxID=51062 RepID=UPI003CC69572